MSSSKLVSPDKVTNKEFAELLASYEPLIDSISASKGAKSGQKTLQELDQFRFVEAPALFSQEAPKRPMNHDDIKVLVDWKLQHEMTAWFDYVRRGMNVRLTHPNSRHGKFRPTLMKLVSSNDSSTAEKTVKEGVEAYQGVSDLSASLNILTRLKGIGPATASLLLAVHYPEQVLFFSDEAYYWLCNKGQKASLKYNMKEYESLNAEARKLMKRLDVSAMDIEKVAYVLLKQEGTASVAKTSASPKVTKDEPKVTTKAASSKRKKSTDEMVEDKGPVRRSKRGKAT